jgi:hypothetical protein
MLILKRDPNCSGDEFYLVHHDGKAVGRIFNQLAGASAPSNATWFWGITFDYWNGRSPPYYGNVATRADAMAAFRAAWERKL